VEMEGVYVDRARLFFGVRCAYMHIHARLRVPVLIFIASDILALKEHVNLNHVNALSTSFSISGWYSNTRHVLPRHQQDTCDAIVICHIIHHKYQLTSVRM